MKEKKSAAQGSGAGRASISERDYPNIDDRLKYFAYKPVNVAPEISLAVYFIVGSILVWQMPLATPSARCVYNTTFGMYVAMMLFLLVPPNALALVNFKAVGKIMCNSRAQPRWFWLKPGFVNWFYFGSDVLFFFACYLAMAFYVWWRPEYTMHVSPSNVSHASAKRRVMLAVTLTTSILYLRSIYCIAEFADGYGSKIYSSELAFYV
ncbi:hypothetical protein IW147_005608 [Coemansia sp. RSA 720]|nr:hypothetical protein IW147_005608 [Coemansia sp. RSA 720]